VREKAPIFALSFTAVHVIDETSPLYLQSIESLESQDIEIIVTFSGIDDAFSQSVFARHSYLLDEIRWNEGFADIVSVDSNGRRSLNFNNFHKTKPKL
jgi:inward rectifier potassium channel